MAVLPGLRTVPPIMLLQTCMYSLKISLGWLLLVQLVTSAASAVICTSGWYG
jgi:hypothetical protein